LQDLSEYHDDEDSECDNDEKDFMNLTEVQRNEVRKALNTMSLGYTNKYVFWSKEGTFSLDLIGIYDTLKFNL